MLMMKRARSAALCILLALSFVTEAFSQAGGAPEAPPSRVSAARRRARRQRAQRPKQGEPAAPQAPAPSPGLPRTVSSSVETYSYRQDSNTPLRVKLAPLGQVVIEFPANDPVYKAHPSNELFVAVDRLSDDSLMTDPIVLRPGTGFRVGRKGEVTPATIVNLQMFSGAIIPVIVIPVNDIEQNTLRVAVTYDRGKVERSRQALGLTVNLEQLIEQAEAGTPANQQPRRGVSMPAPQPSPLPSASGAHGAQTVPAGGADLKPVSYTQPLDNAPAVPSNVVSRPAAYNASPQPTTEARRDSPAAAPAPRAADSPAAPSEQLVALTRDELLSVVRAKATGKFSKALHGLSIAASRSREVDAGTRLVVVAVRNSLSEPVRLVQRQPEIAVEILDDKKRLVDTREVRCLYMQTTLRDNLLQPGEVGYFALVYESPILGTHEYLRARVAQVFAADAPVTADLVITAR